MSFSASTKSRNVNKKAAKSLRTKQLWECLCAARVLPIKIKSLGFWRLLWMISSMFVHLLRQITALSNNNFKGFQIWAPWLTQRTNSTTSNNMDSQVGSTNSKRLTKYCFWIYLGSSKMFISQNYKMEMRCNQLNKIYLWLSTALISSFSQLSTL